MLSVNPYNNQVIHSYDELNPNEVSEKLIAADKAFSSWQEVTYEQRSEILSKAANILTEEKETYAKLMTQEMGKPITQSISEIEKCAWVCEYYANEGQAMLADQIITTEAHKSYVSFRPLGVILAIMPWNFPFWQVFRFAAPTLMAGNCAVLKHAANVSGCSLAIEKIFRKAGLPENVFTSLLVNSDHVKNIIESDRIKAVTLTGSTGAGRAVASTAGQHLKKTVLELGGSDPYVVLADADLDKAVSICTTSRLINTGQSCIAAKRFIVVKDVYHEFIEKMRSKFVDQVIGDPLSKDTTVGPLAREDLRESLHAQVKKSVELGAKCVIGGEIPDRPGAFYSPTILTDVKPGMPAYEEELFGPVASVILADNEEDAIRIANDSVFGLGSAIFSTDIEKAERYARNEIQAGSCFVNDFVKSDPRLPFGGIKESGYGRELGTFGIHEFVNIKTISVNSEN